MNPIERLFQIILQTVASIVRALLGGIFGAPATAVRRVIGPVQVRSATAAEVVPLRHQVLRIGRDRAAAIFDGDHATDTRHWVATAHEGVVGVVSVMRRDPPDASTRTPPGPSLQLRGMAVHPSWQRKGVGRAMLLALHADLRAPMWCNARAAAVPFYEHNGWQRTGVTFEIEGIGLHERMTWAEVGQQ